MASILNRSVLVAAIGYFVDVYDIILFSIVRTASLKEIGVTGDKLLSQGVLLLNVQMAGMFLGGIFWGMMGDKKGRLSVLYGSIFLYSVANFFNAFVHDTTFYTVLRFMAGFGLAGELGAGITLISEALPKEKRGYGTTIIASIGVFGGVAAALIGDFLPWRTCYIIGGIMGFLLLILRISVCESQLFKHCHADSQIKKGNFWMLFNDRHRFLKFLNCNLVGVPIWAMVGILVTFGPEILRNMGVHETITTGTLVLLTYAGGTLGDLMSGVISQFIKSRKKVLMMFISGLGLSALIFTQGGEWNRIFVYGFYFTLGLFMGYWAVMVTNAAEQFGTNLRATVATTVPNFVRGSVIPLTISFEFLRPSFGIINAASIVIVGSCVLALIATYFLRETYADDMDFLETN
jgi:putative MFS transporter